MSNNTAPSHRDYSLVVISDLHLGMKNAATHKLRDFLKGLDCDTLVLNGDIIDGERLLRYPKRKFTKTEIEVIDEINRLVARGTKVIYIPGNHDEELRDLQLDQKTFHGITFANSYVHTDPKGKRFFIFHGDQLFDPATRIMPLPIHNEDPLHKKVQARAVNALRSLSDNEKSVYLGAFIDKTGHRILKTEFNLATRITFSFRYINRARSDFNRNRKEFIENIKSPVSYAKKITFRVQRTDNFKKAALARARRTGFDGIICGHNHRPELMKAEDGVVYANAGDWINNFTALAMDHQGKWKILREQDWKNHAKPAATKKSSTATQNMINAAYKIWPSPKR